MNHFIKLIPALLLISVSFQTKAQEVDLSQKNLISGTTIYTTNTKDFEGSPLLKYSFEEGRVIFSDGQMSATIPLNYDTHKHQVLFINGNDIKILSLPGIKGFVFEKTDNKDKVQERFTLGIKLPGSDPDRPIPIQVLYNGESKLLAYHFTHLMKGNSQDPYTGKVTNRYINDVEYFIQKKNGEFIKTKMKIRNIIKDLGKEHRRKLKSYARKHDLDKRSETDIVELLTYYDEIN